MPVLVHLPELQLDGAVSHAQASFLPFLCATYHTSDGVPQFCGHLVQPEEFKQLVDDQKNAKQREITALEKILIKYTKLPEILIEDILT